MILLPNEIMNLKRYLLFYLNLFIGMQHSLLIYVTIYSQVAGRGDVFDFSTDTPRAY